jgi:hypothetical protein
MGAPSSPIRSEPQVCGAITHKRDRIHRAGRKGRTHANNGTTKCVSSVLLPLSALPPRKFITSIHALSLFCADHPFFVGLQAHPEFCTRPLNPSPPFLGFIAASCGPDVLEQEMTQQLQAFQPPHPKKSMVGEQELIQGSREQLPTAGRERVLSVSGESV